jgi:nucleoside-diphosphate-sugar epimerase
VGFGSDVAIGELAALIRDVVHPEASIEFDTSKPDGMPRKLLDSERLHGLGWRPSIDLESGIRSTYEWYAANGGGTDQ